MTHYSGDISLYTRIVCGEWVVFGVTINQHRALGQGSTKAKAWVDAALVSMFEANNIGIHFYDHHTLDFLIKIWDVNDKNNPEYLWMLERMPELKPWS